jgi:hypothetical protein
MAEMERPGVTAEMERLQAQGSRVKFPVRNIEWTNKSPEINTSRRKSGVPNLALQDVKFPTRYLPTV